MTIDSFRTIKLVASHINDTLPPVRLSGNDVNGRRVLFEVWDGGEPVDTSGLTARLLYTTTDGVGGETALTTTTSNGTAAFVGPFPTEMFGARDGDLAVAITDGVGTMSTLRVPFHVDGAI